MRTLVAPCIGAALVIGLAFAGLLQDLGAHPWWSKSIALIGAPIGAIFATVLGRFTTPIPIPALFATALTAACFAAAHFGKMQFAASYAENTLAGQIWYYGWIATAAGAAATLTLLFIPRQR